MGAIASGQVKEIIKILGVNEIVKRFGGQMNTAFNKLDGHKDSAAVMTKVVPIITAGINSRKAVGAVQVMGPASAVSQVAAVAQLEQDVLGIKIRALIPVNTTNITTSVKRIEGVGVSGIVDLNL